MGTGDGEPREGVVVPWAPGRVAGVRPAAPGEVDAVLDELFGPADTSGPGWFDVVLLVAGAVLVVRGLVVPGVLVMLLGSALPLRSAARRAKRRARERRYRALLATGQPLATGHASTDALLAAYDSLLDAAASAPVLERVRSDAVEAGHRAVVECASLLGGGVPRTGEEEAYVARRTEAVRVLAATLRSVPSAVVEDPDAEARVALVRGRVEVDAVAGTTSLDDLREVAARIERAP